MLAAGADETAFEILPKAVTGIFPFDRGNADFHGRRPGLAAKSESIDAGQNFVHRLVPAVKTADFAKVNRDWAGVAVGIKAQTHFADRRNSIADSPLNLNGNGACALDINGFEMADRTAFFLQLTFVRANECVQVKDVSLPSIPSHFNLARRRKRTG